MHPQGVQRIDRGIQVTWEDGHVSPYPSDYLRRACPCAVCKENPQRQDGLLPASAFPASSIDILKAQPVGWYALQFTFTDRHETGIYSYELLRQFCPCAECQKSSS